MKIVALLCLMATLTGCVTTTATMLSQDQHPPLTPAEVTIYLSEEDVPRKFDKIALMHSAGESTWTNESMMLEALRNKAAKLGANGVLVPQIKEASNGAKVAAAFLGTTTNRRGEAVAIWVHEAETSTQGTPNP